MRIHVQKRLRLWAAAFGAAGIVVASFAPQLHLLVHDHGAHSGAASHASESSVHAPGGELDAAGTAIDAECSLCNLPSPRLATADRDGNRLPGLCVDRIGVSRLAGAQSRQPLPYFSRGPPSIS